MSHIIPIADINKFLPRNKLELDTTMGQGNYPVSHNLFSGLEETARAEAVAKLSPFFITSGWFPTPFDTNATPRLVIQACAMMVAGWIYDRQFAEENPEGSGYGAKKVAEGRAVLEGLIDGTYRLDDEFNVPNMRQPAVHESEPKFIMDARW